MCIVRGEEALAAHEPGGLEPLGMPLDAFGAAITGARHTHASQYLLVEDGGTVEGGGPWVLASDNCYLFRNVERMQAGATFAPGDREANLRALARMVELAGSPERVIPGHDPLQFSRFPGEGRGARGLA